MHGRGTVYGQFAIETLHETHTLFLANGTAHRIEFSLQLTRVDDAPLAADALQGTAGAAAAPSEVISFDE